jgi:hypothetical protein
MDNGHNTKTALANFCPYDLRRTLTTLLYEELQIREAVISMHLNHTKQGVAGKHYNHSTKLVHMRNAIVRWGAFVTRLSKNRASSSIKNAAKAILTISIARPKEMHADFNHEF